MPTIEVITSITGSKDKLENDQVKGNAIWTAYVDDLSIKTTTWNLKPAYDKFKDPRRNSRLPKLLIHKYSDADITIWLDGRMRILCFPEELIGKYLGDYDMAIFKHITRDCLYDEALTVARLKLDDIETIIEQAKYYEDHEYGKHKGLCEGGFIIRRNNERTRAFNEAWWSDYCRFSRRDQLSLMPAIEQSGVNVNFIDEGYVIYPDGTAQREAGLIELRQHLHKEGNFDDPNIKR